MEEGSHPSRSRPAKSVIGSFLGRIHRSKSRGCDEARKLKNIDDKCRVTASISDGNIKNGRRSSADIDSSSNESLANNGRTVHQSPARRLLNRFTAFRRSCSKDRSSTISDCNVSRCNDAPVKTTSVHNLHTIGLDKPNSPRMLADGQPKESSNTLSELDLRFVTTRRDHASVPYEEDFGFGEKSARNFLSENDLTIASTAADNELNEESRTPSYLRISCALNGYTRSPTKLQAKGESLVERRMKLFTQTRGGKYDEIFMSPVVSSRTATTSSESETSTVGHADPRKNAADGMSTPIGKPNRLKLVQNIDGMGNQVSTPGPIKDLISKFDQLDLCSSKKSEKECVENIPPHRLIINQQPEFGDDLKKYPNGTNLVDSTKGKENFKDGDSDAKSTNDVDALAAALKKSLDVDSDQENSESANVSNEKTAIEPECVNNNNNIDKEEKEEENVDKENARTGQYFKEMHDRIKADLEKKMNDAQHDLDNADGIPEKCTDCLRVARGNARLLVRKKFSKFGELIEKNLKPVENDPMPVHLDDLEAFWATIDMELEGILREFAEVEAYRAAGWNENVIKTNEDDDQKKVKPVSKATPKSAKPKAMSAEAKQKLDKQRAAAEQRRAEMRAQMRQKMKEMKTKETEADPTDISTS